MRRKGRARVDRGGDLRGISGGMAKRDGDAGLHKVANISWCLRPVRRKRTELHQPAGGLLPAVELGDGKRAAVGRRGGAGRTDNGGDLWTNDLIYRYDPAANRFTMFEIPVRGTEIRHLSVDERSGTLKVTMPIYRSNQMAMMTIRSEADLAKLKQMAAQ